MSESPTDKKRERADEPEAESPKRQRTPSPTRVVAKVCEYIAFQFENEEAQGVELDGEKGACKYIAVLRADELNQELVDYLIKMKGWISGPEEMWRDENRKAMLDGHCSDMLVDLCALRFLEIPEIEDADSWFETTEENTKLIVARHKELRERARYYDHTEVLPSCRMMRVDTWF